MRSFYGKWQTKLWQKWWKSVSIKVAFIHDVRVFFEDAVAYPSCIRTMTRCIAGPFVTLWGFGMLLKDTLVVLWRCPGTSPCYQNNFCPHWGWNQEPSPTLSYHCPQDSHYEVLIMMLLLHISITQTNVDLIWLEASRSGWEWSAQAVTPSWYCHTGSDNHVAFHPARASMLAYCSADQWVAVHSHAITSEETTAERRK